MKTGRITIKEVERRVDLSLGIYEFMSADTVTVRSHYGNKPMLTYKEVVRMFDDALKTWVYYKKQLEEKEEFEICAKIKMLLDLEQRDCENMLSIMLHPKHELEERRNFYENIYYEIEEEEIEEIEDEE